MRDRLRGRGVMRERLRGRGMMGKRVMINGKEKTKQIKG